MKPKLFALLSFLSLIPMSVFAFGNRWDDGFGGHMGYMGADWGSHMGYLGGGWFMILWMLLLITAIAALVKWIVSTRNRTGTTGNALAILAERYARGEISEEEYQSMKKKLTSK